MNHKHFVDIVPYLAMDTHFLMNVNDLKFDMSYMLFLKITMNA